MVKLARFIVYKRKAFYLIFIAAVIFCIVSIPKVQINDDITAYLPADTETRQGLTLMEEEFTTFGTGQIMISNITFDKAQAIADHIAGIQGVTEVAFDDTEDHYQNASALLTVTFAGEAGEDLPETAMAEIKAYLAGWDVYISSEVGQDWMETLASEMQVILLVAALVIVAVLLITSKSYAELIVFFIVFVVSAVLNMGTNYWFGEISFVTNSIAVVLQLALAVDYAIIFCHRYMEERELADAVEADITALSKAIIEISSSSLTTIAGLVALMLMQFRLGFDLGIVLAKGIVCSLITVFLLMPGLLMLLSHAIDRTRHRNFVPRITVWGKAVLATRFVLPVLFLAVLVGAIVLSNKCDYVFSTNSVDTSHPSTDRIAADKIADTFGSSNTIAVLVPSGDYDKEGQLLRRLEALPEVTSALGLANIPVDDQYMLTDKLTPRQFSEMTGVEIELARLLYQAYGISVQEYGAIFQEPDDYAAPLVKVFLFLSEQRDAGVVTLTEEQNQQIDELSVVLDNALAQLEGENWSRLVLSADVPEEGNETYALLDQIRAIAAEYYSDDVVLVGNSTNARDLRDSFSGDNLKISVLTVLFVLVILLFTFKSAGLPILLVLTIQGSIWINFSFPYLTGTNLFFIAYLIVSAIQMGATIDYAIVITNRYQALKAVMPDKKAAIVETLNQSFPTVFTSGSMMTAAGFLIGGISTDPTISSIGTALGRGTLTSIILVMTVLPQLLLLGDTLIEKTAFTLNRDHRQRMDQGLMRLDGHVRGRVSGFVDAEIRGIFRGEMDASLSTKHGEAAQKEVADDDN